MSKSMKVLILCSFLALILYPSFTQLNNSPVIGILVYPSGYSQYPTTNYSSLSATYVKWFEAAGARVVPIRYDLPAANITWMLSQVNGAFFPGGSYPILNPDGSLNQLGLSMQVVVDFVFASNRNGSHFPMWGTCEGFQMMSLLVSGNYNLMVNMSGCYGVNKPIYFYPQANQSALFDWIPPYLANQVQSTNSCFFEHHYTLDPSSWTSNANLASNFTTMAYTYNPNNVSYVALIAGKEYPFYGSQFHPEYTLFGWGDVLQYPSSLEFSQILANFIVYQARQNQNTFPNIEEYWIYNYEPVPTGIYFETYFFENVNFTKSATQ